MVMRLGRRTEKTFDKEYDALMAAIPFARERGARFFMHYPSGKIREGGTTECEELMLKCGRWYTKTDPWIDTGALL